MGKRPLPRKGNYCQCKPLPTRIRCKAYDVPPSVGIRSGKDPHTVMKPGEYLGPVEEMEHTPTFVSILVKGYWINIWRADGKGIKAKGKGVDFASIVDEVTVARWVLNGWIVI